MNSLKILNFFTILFILNACSVKSGLKENEQGVIALCSGGYSNDIGGELGANYKKYNGKLILKGEVSEHGKLVIGDFEGDTAIQIYNKYVECINTHSKKFNSSNISVSSYGNKSPAINAKGNVNVKY